MRVADFTELQKVLDRKTPSRPTLFEFFLNRPLYERLTGIKGEASAALSWDDFTVKAYHAAGYDYATMFLRGFEFPTKPHAYAKSRSMNDTAVISNRASFDAYPWQDPANADLAGLKARLAGLPAGMKGIVSGPCGVLENVMALVGYEPLAMMTLDDPKLTGDIFDAVGSRLLKYYQIVAPLENVGACISNDDWGFNSQTMLSPQDLRKYVFPWHTKIVKAIHDAGKHAILHSCGQLEEVMDDVIDVMKFDAKHSYEDKIIPVEQAYEKWGRRIAILGGLDLDFVCRRKPQEVHDRAKAMLGRVEKRGAYALGTGNSVPEYVPHENYFAMISAATGMEY